MSHLNRFGNSLDILIIPLAAGLYLSAYLDRGNLGNARLQGEILRSVVCDQHQPNSPSLNRTGLETTVLHGSDLNYSLALAMFYIPYIVLSIPGTLLSKVNPLVVLMRLP
jgi:hypothetical protein